MAANGGSASYLIQNILVLTNEDKAKIEEYYNGYINNTEPIGELWVRQDSFSSKVIQFNAVIGNNDMIIRWYDIRDNKTKYMRFVFINGKYSNHYGPYEDETKVIKDWKWTSTSNENYISDIGSYSLLKIVGYWNGDTNSISTFDITTSNGNTFQEEYGTTYYAMGNRIGTWVSMSFYNDYGNLEIKVDNNLATSDNFTPLGYYYWG